MINRFIAFLAVDPIWYYELYIVKNARPGHDLTDDDKVLLAQFKNKDGLRKATEEMPDSQPWSGKLITLKDCANWLRSQQ